MTDNLPSKIEPIKAIDRAAPDRTMSSTPPWLRSFDLKLNYGSFVEYFEEHQAPTDEQRSVLASHMRDIQPYIEKGPADEMGAALMAMFSAFPSQQLSAETAKARAAMYRSALEDLPAWAIRRGIEFWMRAEHPVGGENYAFAPSPPQLRSLCLKASVPVRDRFHLCQAILGKKVRPAVSEESKRRVAERLAALSLSMDGPPA